jgi:hypothetical protein
MAYVNGEWVDDNDPFKTPYTAGDAGASVQMPTAPAPAPTAATNPRSGNTFDYGNGEIANKVDGGWKYSWRDQPYQDLLSDTDVSQQRQLQQFRQSSPFHVAEDDAGALAQMNGTATGGMTSAISAAQRGVGAGASRDGYNINAPGFQFSDPYTRQLEDVAGQQIKNLSQPQQNPALDTFLKFLGSRFNELTQTPGYSPDDLAVMRTQALEPIEQDRAASNQRALQRAASAGFLPTSGITHLTGSPTGGTESIDTAYDRMRAAAQRDLAINAIGKRTADLNQAVNIGSMSGIQIPQIQRAEDQQRRSEIMNLAQLLYQLPRNAMQDSLAVLNGTEGTAQLAQQQQYAQQAQYQQQQKDAARWASIGQLIANMVF